MRLDSASKGDVEKSRKGSRHDDASIYGPPALSSAPQWSLLALPGPGVRSNINASRSAVLATNQAARDGMVALAGDIERENAVRMKAKRGREAPTADAGTPATPGNVQAEAAENKVTAVPVGDVGEENAATTEAPETNGTSETTGTVVSNASDGTGNGSTGTDATDQDEAARIAEGLARRVRAVGLPVGWDSVQVASINQQFEGRGFWGRLAVATTLLFGYLMVAIAGTLGAPFWFDLLGKFMVVRSTVKPKEKSPDEASKDGGTGGSPVVPADGKSKPGG